MPQAEVSSLSHLILIASSFLLRKHFNDLPKEALKGQEWGFEPIPNLKLLASKIEQVVARAKDI